MAGSSRGVSRTRACRKVLPQIAISVTGAVVAALALSKVLTEQPIQAGPMAIVERPAPAVPVSQLWPRQTDPTRLFLPSFDIAPAAAPVAVQAAPAPETRPQPQAVAAKAEPKVIQAKPRRTAVAVVVLPPQRPASLAVATAEPAPAEPAESPRLFGVKLPGSIARVGGSVATTVASLGERLWDQLP
jgi:type IV secretory pathway VirB10-like protein